MMDNVQNYNSHILSETPQMKYATNLSNTQVYEAINILLLIQ
jgi:hypothetical protein